MQIKLFTISALGGEEQMEEMNKFLRAHRVVTVDKQFCLLGDGAVWSFCVTYVDGDATLGTNKTPERKERIDYRQKLDPQLFAVFSRLRQCRKMLAERDAVAAYMVFTDAELAEICHLDAIDGETIKTLQGVAYGRALKYGEAIARLYQETLENEESGTSD